MKALTWNDLANLYDAKHSGRPARTLPMDKVFEWTEKQTDKFIVSEDGSISLLPAPSQSGNSREGG